mmetsp:Transcript_32733/g.98896  ORF Transcript_32733/g.98896 Transcript_32733/m.98896 type:complete len:223 (+) Transcript_32733:100-768(+)
MAGYSRSRAGGLQGDRGACRNAGISGSGHEVDDQKAGTTLRVRAADRNAALVVGCLLCCRMNAAIVATIVHRVGQAASVRRATTTTGVDPRPTARSTAAPKPARTSTASVVSHATRETASWLHAPTATVGEAARGSSARLRTTSPTVAAATAIGIDDTILTVDASSGSATFTAVPGIAAAAAASCHFECRCRLDSAPLLTLGQFVGGCGPDGRPHHRLRCDA